MPLHIGQRMLSIILSLSAEIALGAIIEIASHLHRFADRERQRLNNLDGSDANNRFANRRFMIQ